MKKAIIPILLLLLAGVPLEASAQPIPSSAGNSKCNICKKEKSKCDYKGKHPEYIKVDGSSSTTKNIDNGEWTGNVIVTTDDTKKWKVSSNASWCTANRRDGATLSLQVSKNTTTKPRTATVTVKTSDGRNSATVTVNQAAGEAPKNTQQGSGGKSTPTTNYYLSVNGNSSATQTITSESNRNTHHFSVSTNASSFQVTLLPSWAKMSNKTANGFDLAIEENIGNERTDWFKITAGSKEIKVTINQKGKDTYLKVGDYTSNFILTCHYASGCTNTYNVQTNADSYSIEGTPSWITISEKNATSFKLQFKSNSGAERSDYFNVKAGNKTIRIDVKQAGNTSGSSSKYLMVNGSNSETTTIHVDNNAHTYLVPVSYSGSSYSLASYSDITWISITNKQNTSFTIDFKANYSNSPRSNYFYVDSDGKRVKVIVEQDGSSSSTTKTASKKHGGFFWDWDMEDYPYGFTFAGYTNYRLDWQSDSDPDDTYRGDDVWGNNGGRIHGAQFGFHFQYCPEWWFGIGFYTGAMFDLFYTFNDPDDWSSDPLSIGACYTSHREYAATVPIHLFLRLPVSFIDGVALWAHAGPDFNYAWGGRYYDNRDDYRQVEYDYGEGFHRSRFNISYSVNFGLLIDHLLIEAGMTHGLTKHNMDDFFGTSGDATFHQFSVRLSYLFDIINPTFNH